MSTSLLKADITPKWDHNNMWFSYNWLLSFQNMLFLNPRCFEAAGDALRYRFFHHMCQSIEYLLQVWQMPEGSPRTKTQELSHVNSVPGILKAEDGSADRAINIFQVYRTIKSWEKKVKKKTRKSSAMTFKLKTGNTHTHTHTQRNQG